LYPLLAFILGIGGVMPVANTVGSPGALDAILRMAFTAAILKGSRTDPVNNCADEDKGLIRSVSSFTA